MFHQLADIVKRNKRDYSKLCMQTAKTALMGNSFFGVAPKIFNKIYTTLYTV